MTEVIDAARLAVVRNIIAERSTACAGAAETDIASDPLRDIYASPLRDYKMAVEQLASEAAQAGVASPLLEAVDDIASSIYALADYQDEPARVALQGQLVDALDAVIADL